MVTLKKIANNFSVVSFGNTKLYFSYETLIGFQKGDQEFVRQNVWSTTTGKHLNQINPDKSTRLIEHDFKDKFQELITPDVTPDNFFKCLVVGK